MKKTSEVYLENNENALSMNPHQLIFGMICIDYKISTNNPKVISYQKDFEAFTKIPIKPIPTLNDNESPLELTISQKKNYSLEDLIKLPLNRKRGMFNITDSNNEKIIIPVNEEEKNSSNDKNIIKNPNSFVRTNNGTELSGVIEEKEETIEKIVTDFIKCNTLLASNTLDKKNSMKNRNIHIKKLSMYMKKNLNNEAKLNVFLKMLGEQTKERPEDIKKWLELEIKYAKIEGMYLYFIKALGKYISQMNKMNIKVDTLENNRDPTLNELRVAVQTKIKKYFELITDYKKILNENTYIIPTLKKLNEVLLEMQSVFNEQKTKVFNRIREGYAKGKIEVNEFEIEGIFFGTIPEVPYIGHSITPTGSLSQINQLTGDLPHIQYEDNMNPFILDLKDLNNDNSHESILNNERASLSNINGIYPKPVIGKKPVKSFRYRVKAYNPMDFIH